MADILKTPAHATLLIQTGGTRAFTFHPIGESKSPDESTNHEQPSPLPSSSSSSSSSSKRRESAMGLLQQHVDNGVPQEDTFLFTELPTDTREDSVSRMRPAASIREEDDEDGEDEELTEASQKLELTIQDERASPSPNQSGSEQDSGSCNWLCGDAVITRVCRRHPLLFVVFVTMVFLSAMAGIGIYVISARTQGRQESLRDSYVYPPVNGTRHAFDPQSY